ncbi:helix-turn-helix domain-containing protein [Paenibacillus konkukensis]|uniref:helix-turn-helix domain-containing protein n=1 Tax=Paenibacillus konkukensis TaxID=2020716 RepID=UPI00201D583B|nr:helix-turn-helix domain-containing protein [Paenibacillus konkukensis]
MNIIKANAFEASDMMLNQSKDVLEHRMKEVEAFARQVALNQNLNYLLSETSPDPAQQNIYGMWKAWRDLAPYSLTNNFMLDFYIYLNDSKIIVSADGAYVRPDDYYELHRLDGWTFERWRDTYLQKAQNRTVLPSHAYSRAGRDMHVITYLQSLTLESAASTKGTLVVHIDENQINSLLRSITDQYGGWAYIVDRDGRSITSLGLDAAQSERPKYASGQYIERDHLIIAALSDYNGWTYVVGLPQHIVMKKAIYIEKITLLLVVPTLLFGLLIALLFAYRNSAPIIALFSSIREHIGQGAYYGKNEYDSLQGNIFSLISQTKAMQDELQQHLPLLREASLKRLVRGEFASVQEASAAMTQTGVELQGEFGYVCIVRIQGYERVDSAETMKELHGARLLIRRMLLQLGRNETVVTDLDSDKLAVLLTYPQEPDERTAGRVESLFDSLARTLKAEFRICAAVSIGGMFRRLADISRSYDEARETLDCAVFAEGGSTRWFRQMIPNANTYYYPIDLELRLMNAVKAGEESEVERLLEQMFTQNFGERSLSAEMAQQLVYELQGTLFKLLEQPVQRSGPEAEQLKAKIESVHHTAHMEQRKERLQQLFLELCHQVIRRKTDGEEELQHNIMEFLHSHYDDADLNLSRIADRLGVPEKTVSQVFKEQTGENLSDYLESIRMKTAGDLLLGSELTIDEIAAKVGYNSAHAFRRAFKRVSGVSPSMYRSSLG